MGVLVALIFYGAIAAIALLALYLVVKAAVKNGILEAERETRG
ncbi:MAG: DUF6019 family protein [Oscillospiraceae bacterium]|nr:DUF6019 family protein [Oscillospiraceae bacterium]